MPHATFELIRREPVASLNLVVEEYEHLLTKARHLHLRAKDGNNAFLVAFATVPQDSRGVAHVLEHTVLCGSERYPVRDPFFMMMRRSLNTFMNALTASDWTAYPFATQNRKDFDNLLKVYLDAVFFPRLDPLDFAQEGHRVEFVRPTDSSSELTYKGVVYNEMKGVMSAPTSQLWQELQFYLFPTITYHHNSGGDPEAIPDLTHEQLRVFHRKHYHPSNAYFLTYGNSRVEEHQALMEDWALSRFGFESMELSIPDERRYETPLRVQTAYPVESEEGKAGKTHIVLGWLLGKSADLRQALESHLLAGVLLDNSASPLRKALETTTLGSAPSELCGLDDSPREMIFACGLEGSEPERAEAVERLILDVLDEVARNGVPVSQVESVLHQLELSQREVGGGRFPYGLQLMMRVLPASLHDGDPIAFLDVDPVLEELRDHIRAPEFIKTRVRSLFLDNPHRVRLTMAPDAGLGARRIAAEKERLRALRAAMKKEQVVQVIEQARILKARQEAEDNPERLPKVGLQDIPAELPIPEGYDDAASGVPLTWFYAGTNGLVYQQLVVDLPRLSAELVDDLPLFCALMTEVGWGKLDYLQAQARQAALTGGLSARASIRGRINDVQRVGAYFVLRGKALARNQESLSQLLREIFLEARFHERTRLRELVSQIRASQEARVTDHGHVLAMVAATAGMGPCGALAHRWEGLEGLRRLRRLDDALEDGNALAAFALRLERIQAALLNSRRQILVVCEEGQHESIRATLEQGWSPVAEGGAGGAGFTANSGAFSVKQGWTTTTHVNFCAKAYSTVPQDHRDAPALTVLGPFLRNGFLHRAIREQGGAYGAGASYRPDTGAFGFSSYRDPRVAETLADFDRAVEWVATGDHEFRLLEEAILSVIGDIDRPDSPAGEAIGAFFGELHGRDAAQRRRFRRAILDVTLDDLKRVSREYLVPGAASIAVLSNSETLTAEGQDLELEIEKL
jgi:Zn-dependent M16 (insulinase) family peptidase